MAHTCTTETPTRISAHWPATVSTVLNMTNLVDEVASIRLFSACTKRDLQRLAKAVDHADLKAGDELTRDRAPSGGRYS